MSVLSHLRTSQYLCAGGGLTLLYDSALWCHTFLLLSPQTTGSHTHNDAHTDESGLNGCMCYKKHSKKTKQIKIFNRQSLIMKFWRKFKESLKRLLWFEIVSFGVLKASWSPCGVSKTIGVFTSFMRVSDCPHCSSRVFPRSVWGVFTTFNDWKGCHLVTYNRAKNVLALKAFQVRQTLKTTLKHLDVLEEGEFFHE